VKENRLVSMLQEVFVHRQRLLISEANYLRELLGMPPVMTVEQWKRHKDAERRRRRMTGNRT